MHIELGHQTRKQINLKLYMSCSYSFKEQRKHEVPEWYHFNFSKHEFLEYPHPSIEHFISVHIWRFWFHISFYKEWYKYTGDKRD